MSADIKNSLSAVPATLATAQLTTSEATLYTIPSGVGGDVLVKITNTTNASGAGTTQKAFVSQVKSGGTGGSTNRICSKNLPAGESVYIECSVGEGDFFTGSSDANSAITVVIDGVSFTSNSVTASGIQTDAVGTGGYATSATSVTGQIQIGTGSNRLLLSALIVSPSSTIGSYTTYDTLGMTCANGAMTKLRSADFNQGGNLNGSIHLFSYTNPTSNTLHTITGNAAKGGVSFNLTILSVSYAGVASVTGGATDAPSTASTLNLSISSAAGHRPFFATAFANPPQTFRVGGSARALSFTGAASYPNTPGWLMLADGIGAATVTATTANTDLHAALAVDLVPA
jgi:hypothetical protein